MDVKDLDPTTDVATPTTAKGWAMRIGGGLLSVAVGAVLLNGIEGCPAIVVTAERTRVETVSSSVCKALYVNDIKLDAERKRQAALGKPSSAPQSTTPVAGSEAAKSQTQSAPTPAPVPVPVTAPTPVAPPPVLASVEPPPPVVAAPVDPVRKLCPSLVIPTGAASVSTFDSQVCAIAACAGESASVDDNIAMLVGWRNLTNGLERDACRAGDRAFLSDNKTMGRVLDAIEQAPIPEADPAHDVCRAIRNKAVISMNAARPRLLPPDRIPASCPKTAGDTSAAVAAFIDRFGLR